MLDQKRTIALAVLVLLMGAAAFGAKLFPWQTQAAGTQNTSQEDGRKDKDPGAERVTTADKQDLPAHQGTRREFARAMSKIKEGMAEKDILALLGKPDDVRTRNDPGGISTTRTKEIWRYGSDGHLTFPTLGCIYIDNENKVQYVFGDHGEPPDPKIFSEADLRSLLRLIDKAPSYNSGYQYDPLAVIQIVNALQPLGKEKALAAIEEYLRVASCFHSPAREGVFLVLRVLFDVPADPGHMPHMYVGAPASGAQEDAKRLPRFPILLQDDVPLMLVSGYMLAGKAEQPESHVKYFRDKGRLREKPLVPGNAPLGLLDSVAKNCGWLDDEEYSARSGKMLIANQLLYLVNSVYRRDTDGHGYRFWCMDNVDGRWKAIEAAVAKLDIRWSAEKTRYTFADGSHLPESIRKLYRRHIWKVEGLHGEAALTFERIDIKHVWISLEWSGKTAQKMPPFLLNVFAVKDNANALAELRTMSISSFAGDQAFSSQIFHVELPDGDEVQARLKIGKREQLSPVYTP